MAETPSKLWLKVWIGCLAFFVAGTVLINALGGFAHPFYFVFLGLAVATGAALVVSSLGEIESYDWPLEDSPPVTVTFGAEERVRVLQHRMAGTAQQRAASLGPTLADIVAERLWLRHQLDLDREPERARELVSADLAAAIGLDEDRARQLDRQQLIRLTEEIENL